ASTASGISRRGAKNRTDSDERPRGDSNRRKCRRPELSAESAVWRSGQRFPLADNEADPRPMIHLLAGLGLLRDHVTLWLVRLRGHITPPASDFAASTVPAPERIEEVTSIVRLPRPSLK